MINNNAIQLLEDHFQDFDLAANLLRNQFANNVQRFLELKGLLHEVNVAEDVFFQRRFADFYGVKRMSRDLRSAYFARFEIIKNVEEPINVRELTEEMANELGKYHFSFCSKMANLINDEMYPIYDRNVAKVFHRPGLGYGLDYKTNLYQDLCDTYRYLENHPLVEAFRNRFNAEDMGYMKVLDALFWVIGANMQANG